MHPLAFAYWVLSLIISQMLILVLYENYVRCNMSGLIILHEGWLSHRKITRKHVKLVRMWCFIYTFVILICVMCIWDTSAYEREIERDQEIWRHIWDTSAMEHNYLIRNWQKYLRCIVLKGWNLSWAVLDVLGAKQVS